MLNDLDAPEQEFGELARELTGHMVRYASRRVGQADAEDAASDAWVVAWRRWGEAPGDKEERARWVLGILKNVLKNYGRSARRRGRLVDEIGANIVHLHSEPAQDVVMDEIEVERILGMLPERDAHALRLIRIEGYSSSEVAESLGVKPGAFAVRMFRARRRLERELRKESDPRW
ncbi:MAG TPA: sigma-70 family RNA polymerase sigma factor [Arachnia sp.]|nr:sigma-70 family RNA polymerase sigma factor [Arachnia sp.]HMT85106.1 sigma-70 family RNA polymerase sigma factor [Arachnia sp.]